MPVEPSQAMVAKTNTFGSGRSSQVSLQRKPALLLTRLLLALRDCFCSCTHGFCKAVRM